MVTDHSKANDELKQWARQKNVTLPTGLDAKSKATRDRLAKLSGAAFDKAYVQDMVRWRTTPQRRSAGVQRRRRLRRVQRSIERGLRGQRGYDRSVPLNFWAFTAITAPLVATPGASTAVVLRNSLAGGVRSGVAAAVGTNSGSICYGLLTAFGMSAALERWPTVWLALRIGGAIYLAWLGVRSLHHAVSYTQPDTSISTSVPPPPLARSVREGFLTNALNPSLATLYLVILPQFIPRGAPFVKSALSLMAIHVSMAATWHVTWAVAGGALAATLSRTRPRRVLEAITGTALLALALKVAI